MDSPGVNQMSTGKPTFIKVRKRWNQLGLHGIFKIKWSHDQLFVVVENPVLNELQAKEERLIFVQETDVERPIETDHVPNLILINDAVLLPGIESRPGHTTNIFAVAIKVFLKFVERFHPQHG